MKYIGISKDSREIKPGYIYACFQGLEVDGYDYIDQAKANGAIKIIGEQSLEIENYEQVEDINQALVEYSMLIYNNPQKKIKLVGVTGTDGKTSTALLVDKLLNKKGKSSYLGTNGFFINEKEMDYSGFTTPFADILFKNLSQSVEAESDFFIMEVSSHALVQKRTLGLQFEVAIFTNLGEEHLDFHKTQEEYFLAKRELFLNLTDQGTAIINVDDDYGKKLYQLILEQKRNYQPEITIITIGKSLAEESQNHYQISEIDSQLEYTNFCITNEVSKEKLKISSPLIAEFNIYNLTQALLTAKQLDFPLSESKLNLNDLFIPGRLEVIKKGDNPTIIIDFAHTKEAIAKVMKFVTETKKSGKIWTLTGSAGGRDGEKRPGMGKAATDYADICIFTEDDPRHEKVEKIISDLKKGISNNNCEIYEIPNRKQALKYMIDNAKIEDTIILFGKGSMKEMYYDGYKEKYQEKEEVIKLLK